MKTNLLSETTQVLLKHGYTEEDVLYISSKDRLIHLPMDRWKAIFNKDYESDVSISSRVSVASDLVIQLKDGNFLERTIKDIGSDSVECWDLVGLWDKDLSLDVFSRAIQSGDPSVVSFDVKDPELNLTSAPDSEDDDADSEESANTPYILLTTLNLICEHTRSHNVHFNGSQGKRVDVAEGSVNLDEFLI